VQKKFLDKFRAVLISPDTINKVKWAEIWGNRAFIKMVWDRKELSTDLKETIIGLDQEGYSACKIAEFLSLNRRTVSYIIKRYREWGTVENLPNSGRIKNMNLRTDRLLLRMVKTNRRQTLGDLTSKFNNTTSYKLSQRTVQRHFHDAGFKRRIIAKSITIRGVNRGKRRTFCRSKYHWNVREHWSKIIFSDEM
jgi:transposase